MNNDTIIKRISLIFPNNKSSSEKLKDISDIYVALAKKTNIG